MSDSFTETTSQGWMSRIFESIKGVVAGLLLVVLSFPVLWWNEGRSVQTYKSLQEGRGAVVEADADKPAKDHDGRLVHISGGATTDETLQDPQFNVSAKAIHLRREAQMYQWVEHVETKKEKKVGGGEETTKTYNYSTEWRDRHVSSSDFRIPDGHHNPAEMPYRSESFSAQKVNVSAFALSAGLIQKINGESALPLDDEALEALPAEVRARAKRSGEWLYLGADPSSPAVGDMRVRFTQVQPTEVSVIAKQMGPQLSGYKTKAGDTLEMLAIGVVPAQDMFQAAEDSNVMLTWILRLVGFLMMLIGLVLIFRPLSVVADVIPFIGDLVGMGSGVIAFAIAAPLSLLTIAVAWIVYRPLLGVALLLVAVGIGFGLKKVAGKRKSAKEG